MRQGQIQCVLWPTCHLMFLISLVSLITVGKPSIANLGYLARVSTGWHVLDRENRCLPTSLESNNRSLHHHPPLTLALFIRPSNQPGAHQNTSPTRPFPLKLIRRRLPEQPNTQFQCFRDETRQIFFPLLVTRSRICPREERQGEVLGCFANVGLDSPGPTRVRGGRCGCVEVDG